MFGKEKDVKNPSAIVGLVGRGMTVEGRLTFEHTVKLDGEFKGEITGKGTLVVGEGAAVDAEINVDIAIVTGVVRGVLEAGTRVEIRAPGKVFGEIRTPNLIIGDGAVFEGNSVMLKKATPSKPFEIHYPESDEEARGAGGPARPGEEGLATSDETRRGAG